jgi:predicted nucleotidyltransferase
MPSTVETIRDRILAACPSVSRIVLFGSRARGDGKEDSDYDLLIVVPREARATASAARLRLALWDVPASFDLVVLSEDEVAAVRGYRSGVVHRALTEGVVLHEAA